MARDRFIHMMAVTAIASGVLASVSVARAEGGGNDRAQMQFNQGQPGRSQSQRQNAAVVESDQVEPLTPLPPRRPKGLEAVAEAPAPVAEAAPTVEQRPVRAGITPPSTLLAQTFSSSQPYQRVGNSTVFKLSAQPLVAEQPLPSGQFGKVQGNAPTEPVKSEVAQADDGVINMGRMVKAPLPPSRPSVSAEAAPPANGATHMAALSPVATVPGTSFSTMTTSQPAAVATPVSPQVEPEPELATAFTTRAPLPPLRPRGLEEDGARIEQASLPSGPDTQQFTPPPQPTTNGSAYNDPRGDSGGNSPGFFQRLFTAPPGRVNEAVSNEPSRPRSLSRLNHVIGDDPARASQLKSLIAKHAAANGLPFKFADAVVRVESRYNSRARNGPYIGLMQIHPRTAASLGYGGDTSGLFDPDTNLQYGIKYLAMAYRLANGDTCGTIMRYQGGHRAVSMTSANRTYCNKVKMIFGENLR